MLACVVNCAEELLAQSSLAGGLHSVMCRSAHFPARGITWEFPLYIYLQQIVAYSSHYNYSCVIPGVVDLHEQATELIHNHCCLY